jgi:mannonate dehydratase
MNITHPGLNLPKQSFRWYGPNDPVPLSYIRQAGAEGLFSSLHHIPYGELWTREEVRKYNAIIENAGLTWDAVESVPVHEEIKTGKGNLKQLFYNYKETIRNLGAEGINVVIYNFMPVLDWIRTDMHYKLPDGSECLRYDPVRFAAFEIYALQRPGAEEDFTASQLAYAKEWWNGLNDLAKEEFIQSIIDVFPGCKLGLKIDDIRTMLAQYTGIGENELRANLARFLEEVVPVAEEAGVKLAIHPDDPPFPVLGLPRILSKASDIETLLNTVDSPANGLCFCAGSLSARPSNDLPAMAKQFAPRIHAVHLRSTQQLPDGSFYEADHLAGSVDMPAVVQVILDEQDRRFAEGRADWRLAFRPDHGHTMMDDLEKKVEITPGYSCIGRSRGLAELRGLMLGLRQLRKA